MAEPYDAAVTAVLARFSVPVDVIVPCGPAPTSNPVPAVTAVTPSPAAIEFHALAV